uniref:DNA2/NAM7 helicase-like C-terminal domain-containing protein n=1 Tax=Panagrolaimus sp. ES5 TaxID=591445 RepID=A0AC34FAZ1_9BILA
MGFVEKLENINDLSNDLICLYSCLFCIFAKDKIETIEDALLNWNIYDSGYAQVTYKKSHEFDGDQSHNSVNSLFTRYSTAILKRHISDENGKTKEGEMEAKEIHVKINKSLFKEGEIIIGFKVKVDEVMKEWNLENARELVSSKFSLEPKDIFEHWRPFIEKLVENEFFLQRIVSKPSSQAAILKAFIPNFDRNNNMQIFTDDFYGNEEEYLEAVMQMSLDDMKAIKLPDPDEEKFRDSFLKLGQLPYAHKIARVEIAKQKLIVIIDGAPQTGKTTLNTFIIPDILQRNIEKEFYEESAKCLALVSSTITLKNQLELIQKSGGYCRIAKHVRILNLLDFNELRHGSFLKTLEKIIKEYTIMEEEKEKLKAGINLIKTKFCAFHHESTNEYDRDIILPNLSKEEKKALAESAEVYGDDITSKELQIFQDALKVIFFHYRPNFIIASNETFISLLPSMNQYISHILVDESGKTPFIEVINMIAEIPNLKQLVLNGDITQYPYYHRLHLENRPECYDNGMKMINLASPELSYIQLNKTFYMHPGIVQVLNECFYSDRILIPLFSPESYKVQFKNLNLLENFEIPISFHNVDKADEYVPPTTRKNYYQSFIAMKLIQKLLSCNLLQKEKILVLCNYSAEKKMMQENLKKRSQERMVKVKCVDNCVGEHSDIVIYITTRAIDEKIFHDADSYQTFLYEGSYELGDLKDNFHYVFERQRIQTAISRAKKAVFIVGSKFLLENCPEWKALIQMIHDDNHFAYPNIVEQMENEQQ